MVQTMRLLMGGPLAIPVARNNRPRTNLSDKRKAVPWMHWHGSLSSDYQNYSNRSGRTMGATRVQMYIA